MHSLGNEPIRLESPLLNLPIELRRQIYAYVLPSTFLNPVRSASNIIWRRGDITLLQLCQHTYADCMDLLYGTNAFEIDITYDGIRFRYTWLIPSGLKPKALYPFPDYFSQRNTQRMRNFVVNVEHCDDYTGRIKYNMGGAGLTAGVRSQVLSFVNEVKKSGSFGRVLVRLSYGNRILSDIRRVKVHCVERGRDSAAAQTVLSPLKYLRGVGRAEICGSVTPAYAAEIERAMMGEGAKEELAPLEAPAQDIPQDPAVLWRWRNSWNA